MAKVIKFKNKKAFHLLFGLSGGGGGIFGRAFNSQSPLSLPSFCQFYFSIPDANPVSTHAELGGYLGGWVGWEGILGIKGYYIDNTLMNTVL